MVALMVATLVIGLREKSARAKAMKDMAPQSLEPSEADGGEAPTPIEDGFGDPSAPEELAELDENAFK